MTYLLDVNVLLALLWEDHPDHPAATVWIVGRTVAVCPIAEIGFLRISANPRAIGASMERARGLLADFLNVPGRVRINDDIPALESPFARWDSVTDVYLAELARKHGMKLATFDTGIRHTAVELIS